MSTVTITRSFDAPPALVFAAWTEPERIARWYGPSQFEVPVESVTVDLRPGGRWELTMVRRDGGGEHPVGYEVVEVDAPALLVLRSDPMPQLPEPTVLRLELQATAAGTRLTLTEGPMPDRGAAAAEAGYAAALEELAVALAA